VSVGGGVVAVCAVLASNMTDSGEISGNLRRSLCYIRRGVMDPAKISCQIERLSRDTIILRAP
jgi:hypothetical protein